jgi:hypothetical protein
MEPSTAAEPYEAHFRDNVLGVLRLLASPEAQLDYQRRVPIAQVSAELFCQWADDTFWPDDLRLQALFSPEEWFALLAFHSRFESISSRSPAPLPPIDEFVKHPLGRELAEAARDALRFFPNEHIKA